MTVHKSQGATVDRAYVLASGGMDQHLAYVAMTRHRDQATLYAGRDDFRSEQALAAKLSRERPKASTLDYAERRGFETPTAWIEDAWALLERGRERLGEAWQRASKAIELVRERVAQRRPERERTPEERRREALREALDVATPAQSARTKEQMVKNLHDASPTDASNRNDKLRQALNQDRTAEPRQDRDALRAALSREDRPAPLTKDQLRRALEEPEKPTQEPGKTRDRGHDLER
ncbi:MAG: hypothetical protein ACRYHQ_15100 [Janthinobacterium lividum]